MGRTTIRLWPGGAPSGPTHGVPGTPATGSCNGSNGSPGFGLSNEPLHARLDGVPGTLWEEQCFYAGLVLVLVYDPNLWYYQYQYNTFPYSVGILGMQLWLLFILLPPPITAFMAFKQRNGGKGPGLTLV